MKECGHMFTHVIWTCLEFRICITSQLIIFSCGRMFYNHRTWGKLNPSTLSEVFRKHNLFFFDRLFRFFWAVVSICVKMLPFCGCEK